MQDPLFRYAEELAAEEKVVREVDDRVGFDTRGRSKDAKMENVDCDLDYIDE